MRAGRQWTSSSCDGWVADEPVQQHSGFVPVALYCAFGYGPEFRDLGERVAAEEFQVNALPSGPVTQRRGLH